MEIKRYQDINISDSILKNDYSKKYINGDYISAYNILSNDELESKKFVAEVLNNIVAIVGTDDGFVCLSCREF